MSELKVYVKTLKTNILGKTIVGQSYYLKNEADNVIANKECEIKKLKDSLDKLLKAKTEQIMDEVMQKTLIYGEGFVPVEHVMRLVSELRSYKFKRCLAMAKWCLFWKNYWHCCEPTDSGAFIARESFFSKWQKRWLKIAEKFKEVK